MALKFKQIGYFLLLAFYVLGTINGIGYGCYLGEYPMAIGSAVLAYMAWPTAVKYWKYLDL